MPQQKRALLIEFDVNTGKRAGDIDPKDPNLQCYGWQVLDGKNSLEIRLVEDDRDLSQYENVSGVTILKGKTDINNAITNNIPPRYRIIDKDIVIAEIKEKGLDVNKYQNMDLNEIAKSLHGKGIGGIKKEDPQLI